MRFATPLQTKNRGREFALLVRHFLAAEGRAEAAAQSAGLDGAPEHIVQILRTAVAIGGASGAWGTQLADYDAVVGGFLASLANDSVFDRLLADNALTVVPLGQRVVAVTGAGEAASGAPGVVRPITALDLSAQALAPRTVGSFLVLSNDVIRGGGAAGQAFIETQLRSAVGVTTDAEFFSVVTAGVSPISTGTTFATRFAAMFAALTTTGAGSRVYLCVAPNVARTISGLAATDVLYANMSVSGGTIGRTPVVVSDALAAGTGVLIDAATLAGGNESLNIDLARHASLQMANNPSNGASNLVSLWQTNSAALRITRRMAVAVARSGGVVVHSGMV